MQNIEVQDELNEQTVNMKQRISFIHKIVHGTDFFSQKRERGEESRKIKMSQEEKHLVKNVKK